MNSRGAFTDSGLSVLTGGPRAPLRPTAGLLAAVLASTSAGCSLLYVKGPQPEVKPPPPCTTSNALPVEDVILAGTSVVVLTTGAILHANETVGSADHGKGAGLMVVGGIGALFFATSAIVGYSRTADCRAWLVPGPVTALSHEEGCPAPLPGRGRVGLACGRGRGGARAGTRSMTAPALKAWRASSGGPARAEILHGPRFQWPATAGHSPGEDARAAREEPQRIAAPRPHRPCGRTGEDCQEQGAPERHRGQWSRPRFSREAESSRPGSGRSGPVLADRRPSAAGP